ATLTATGAFTVSKDNTNFSTTLTFTKEEADNKAQTVYVRFAPQEEGRVFEGTLTLFTTGVAPAVINLKGTSIDPATTLEVVNWNVEWFGHTGNGPSNEDLQQQNVKTILSNVGADIYALAEVVDESRLAQVVSQMPGYTYVISDFGSHTNTALNPMTALATAQKLAFVYKTDIFSNVSTKALLSTGINTAGDAASDAYYWWSSGRYPYMLSADVTLNGSTKSMKFVLVHAKANTNPLDESYERRKKGADALYALLQAEYPNDRIVILGDYNDDLDQSITSGFTTTSWNKFTEDNASFEELTLPLSLAGRKSTVSYNDMIDHVVISNELKPYYMASTATVLSDVSGMVANYSSTTSDHYPIFTRYMFCKLTAPSNITVANEAGKCGAVVNYAPGATMTCGPVTSSHPSGSFFPVGSTTVTLTAGTGETASFTVTVEDKEGPAITIPAMPVLCYTATGTYSLPAVVTADNCGIESIRYAITGATTRSGEGANAGGAFHPGTSTITWTVTDIHGNPSTQQTTVQVAVVQASIPDVVAVTGGLANTIYTGYGPNAVTLTAQVDGGNSPYTTTWRINSSSGAALSTAPTYTVSPKTTTTYYLSVADQNGCTETASKTVNVVDVRCGPKMDKVALCAPSGKSMICVAKQAVTSLLAGGAQLGTCTQTAVTQSGELKPKAEKYTALRLSGAPNPSAGAFNLQVTSNFHTPVQLRVTDLVGRTIEVRKNVVPNSTLQIGAAYKAGVYMVEVVQGEARQQVKLIKQ
ncbi:MAG: T9SS type A sorting domain-containing protein, partial [Bacteroidota bacterium]|nr:T9SS type A sorting domain-containing protein [Bacteroidota bacterium]